MEINDAFTVRSIFFASFRKSLPAGVREIAWAFRLKSGQPRSSSRVFICLDSEECDTPMRLATLEILSSSATVTKLAILSRCIASTELDVYEYDEFYYSCEGNLVC